MKKSNLKNNLKKILKEELQNINSISSIQTESGDRESFGSTPNVLDAIGNFVGEVKGLKIYSLEDSSINDTVNYGIILPSGKKKVISIDVDGERITAEEIVERYKLPIYLAKFIINDLEPEFSMMDDDNEY